MNWNPYIEAGIHAVFTVGLIVFMVRRSWLPITPAGAKRTDHGYWILPVGLLCILSLARILYLILNERILGYPM